MHVLRTDIEDVLQVEIRMCLPFLHNINLYFQQSTAASMQMLVTLDEVKTRMEETGAALREAENWSQLSQAIHTA